MRLLFLFLIFVTTTSNNLYCQVPKLEDKIASTVVIGFPTISNQQLNDIKAEFLNKSQITSAVFVYGNNDLMLINIDTQQNEFKQYYDLLKIISPFYNTDKCYFKPTYVYSEINNSLSKFATFTLK